MNPVTTSKYCFPAYRPSDQAGGTGQREQAELRKFCRCSLIKESKCPQKRRRGRVPAFLFLKYLYPAFLEFSGASL